MRHPVGATINIGGNTDDERLDAQFDKTFCVAFLSTLRIPVLLYACANI